MPLGVTDRPGVLQPHHAILRMVEGVAGEVEIESVYEPRFGYGRVTPRLYDRKRLGFWCTPLYRTKIRIADIVDKCDVLAPSAHPIVASSSRAVPLACLADLIGCFESGQIHGEIRSWLDVDVF
jgi:hypothetical protein